MIRLVALSAIATVTAAHKATANELITNQGAGLQLIASFDRLPLDFATTDGLVPVPADLSRCAGTTDDGHALARDGGELFTSNKDLSQ